jgi:hypothetical protein
MGTDISVYAEIKKGDKWSLVREDGKIKDLFGWRNYDLFGLLANIRHHVPYGFQPRGFPNNISDDLQAAINNHKVANPTWDFEPSEEDADKLINPNVSHMTLDELIHASHVWDATGKRTNFFDILLPYLKTLKEKTKLIGTQVRIVFWFW